MTTLSSECEYEDSLFLKYILPIISHQICGTAYFSSTVLMFVWALPAL